MPTRKSINAFRLDSLIAFFDVSPVVRLLRADNAPYIIDFLGQTFKSGESIVVGQADLRSRLALYQEEIHESDPEALSGTIEKYIAAWTEAGWLHRFLEAIAEEPQFELTRHSEAALRFIDSVVIDEKSLIGTESRLRLVIETLEDIVEGASADPERRLNILREQRRALDEEIVSIESGKAIQVYRPAQIRERFQTAVHLLRDLQSDFRAVEEHFQIIARDVQQLQAAGNDTRGGILGYALDAEDLLKTQDEGISFFAFVAFLFSPAQQASLGKTIQELQRLAALADQTESMSRVKRMVPGLLAEADKVMRTTARLSTSLRRLLDARAAADRVRLANVLRDIRKAAIQLGEAPIDKSIELVVEADIDLASPMSRTFWAPPQAFADQEVTEHRFDSQHAFDVAAAFARLQRLDFRKMRRQIREATVEGQSVMLADLVRMRPIEAGVIELLSYLQIAHDDGHRIDHSILDTIILHEARFDSPISVSIPRVTFLPKASSSVTSSKAK